MICETCLGDNPYMRMTKLPFGQKLCRVSQLPYQAFRWKAGVHGRFKETIICYVVAKEKNICQACLNDMQYGLPVGVRDAMLQKQQQSDERAAVHSNVLTQYHYNQLLESDGNGSSNEISPMAQAVVEYTNGIAENRQLLADFAVKKNAANTAAFHLNPTVPGSTVATKAPQQTAFRNLPKLCSFWLNGTCRRVGLRTCPFRPCCGSFIFPELLGGDSAAKEAHKTLVARLESEGADKVQRSLGKDMQQLFHEAMKRRNGNQQSSSDGKKVKGESIDDSIRARVHGTDALSQKYLGQLQSTQQRQQDRAQSLEDADNEARETNNRVLFLGPLPSVLLATSSSFETMEGVSEEIRKQVLRDHLSQALMRYQVPVLSVRVALFKNPSTTSSSSSSVNSSGSGNAFVEYPEHGFAAAALERMRHDPPVLPTPLLLTPPSSTQPFPANNVQWQPLRYVRWATAKGAANSSKPLTVRDADGEEVEAERMAPPPGMENRPVSHYSAPGLAQQVPLLPLYNSNKRPPPPPGAPPSILSDTPQNSSDDARGSKRPLPPPSAPPPVEAKRARIEADSEALSALGGYASD